MFEAASYMGHKIVEPGDLVINSLWAWATGLGVSMHRGIVSPVYGVYRLTDDQCDVAYLDFLLRSNACQWQFQVRSKGIWKSRLSLTDEAFLDMLLVLPPLDEQKAIAQMITSRTAAIDAAMAAVENEIALLKEYRVRLISDVVTGKLDVRKDAASLKDVDPSELAAVLAGGATSTDEEEGADGDE
jgi:type I restriction enzyme S subunit